MKESMFNPSLEQEPNAEKKENINLKGEKTEISFTKPIDVYLDEKHLQIIDVRGQKQWNADYLLVDPLIFDPENPEKGFKGIRENEPIFIGRNNPGRFDFPKTVSREHLKIELKDGLITIEYLESTNGTLVETETTPEPEPNQPEEETIELKSTDEALTKEKTTPAPEPNQPEEETIEKESYPEREIADFFDYIRKNKTQIEERLSKGSSLAAIFYHNFYNVALEKKYHFSDPETQKLGETYTKEIEKIRRSRSIRGSLLANDYWIGCYINQGLNSDSSVGRLYLNLKPEHAKRFFLQTRKRLIKKRINGRIKILRDGTDVNFNRLDKMVIYFHPEQEKETLEALETLYQQNPKAFDETGIPRFSANIRDSKDQTMRGIGFAQKPKNNYESFGEIISIILAEIYFQAKKDNLDIDNPDFDFKSHFKETCIKHGVNPASPAFSLENDNLFTEFKKRALVL